MADTPSLNECYQDAALQRYLMRPVAHATDGPVFYAIDTDVVASFLEPSERAAASREQRIGLGEIFRADSQKTKEAIAAQLLDRIMIDLSPSAPFILLWPIDGEVQRLFETYRNKVTLGHASTDEETTRIYDRLVAAHPENAALFSIDLVKRAVWLNGMVTALSRVVMIFRKGRLLREGLVTAETHGDRLSWAMKAAAPPFSSVTRTWEFSQRRQDWRNRFDEIGRSDSDQRERDVEALTRLEMTNLILEKAETTPPSLPRLLYLTGDSSVLRAAENYKWKLTESETTFALQFIRHPRSFIDDLGVLRATSRSGEEVQETIYDWLTLLLGRFEDMLEQAPSDRGRIEFSQSLKDQIREAEAAGETTANDIQKSWSQFAASAVKKPATILDRLRQAADKGELIEAPALIAELQRDEREAWLMVLEVSVAARFAIEVATPRPDVPRDAPLLIMHERPRLTEFLNVAANWLDNPAQYAHDRYRDLRDAVRREEAETTAAGKDSDHSYGDFVAHAYLLAHQGQWRTAAILAALASESVGEAPNLEPSGNNGREAAYVEACCRRLTARTRVDLEEAERHCRRALEMVSKEFDSIAPNFDDLEDLIMGHASIGQGHIVDPVAERFIAELLAIRAMILELEWFDPKTARETTRAAEIRDATLVIAGLFFALARHSSKRLGELPSGSLSERAAQKAVEMCCRAGLSLHLQFADLTDQLHWNSLSDVIQLLKDQVGRNGNSTELSHIVLTLINVAQSASNRTSRRMLDQIQFEHPVLAFDTARLSEMVGNVRRVVQ